MHQAHLIRTNLNILPWKIKQELIGQSQRYQRFEAKQSTKFERIYNKSNPCLISNSIPDISSFITKMSKWCNGEILEVKEFDQNHIIFDPMSDLELFDLYSD